MSYNLCLDSGIGCDNKRDSEAQIFEAMKDQHEIVSSIRKFDSVFNFLILQSAFVKFLVAKHKLRNGQLERAGELFKETLKSQDEWQQLGNACYENLMWTYA